MASQMPSAQAFWDAFYTDHTWAEHGPVNRHLISETDGLTPGTVLDLGCGEGSDALWLAGHGWTVIAVNVSETALERARAHARRLGLDARITFEAHDLAADFPEGTFDLVSVLHLRRAAE